MECNASDSRSDPECFMFEDYNQRIVIATVMIIVTILGTIGNTLVIVGVILSRRLRSSTNLFIVNLAFADFFACLSFPSNVVAMLSRDGWPLPNWICATSAAVFYICLGASVMTLALIAYNRWYLLTQPIVKFMTLYETRNIFIMLLAAWTYPSALVLGPYFAGMGILGYSKEYKTCSQDTSLPTSDMYSLIAGVGVIIPIFIIIVFIYARIYFFVSRQTSAVSKKPRSKIIKLEMSSTKVPSTKATNTSDTSQSLGDKVAEGTTSTNNTAQPITQPIECGGRLPKALNETPGERDGGEKVKVNKYQVTVTKRLAIVVMAFFICMLPFGISVAVPPSDPGIPWTALLKTVNSCVNPFIYARTMPEFRRVMWAVMRCRLREIPEPIACLRHRR